MPSLFGLGEKNKGKEPQFKGVQKPKNGQLGDKGQRFSSVDSLGRKDSGVSVSDAEDAKREVEGLRKMKLFKKKTELEKGAEFVSDKFGWTKIRIVNCFLYHMDKPNYTAYIKSVNGAIQSVPVLGRALSYIGLTYSAVSLVTNGWYVGVHSRKKARLNEIRKDFTKNMDEKYGLEKLRKKELLKRRNELKKELEELRIGNAMGIGKNEDLVKEKQRELNHLEEYIAIRNLNDKNKTRIINEKIGVATGLIGVGTFVATSLAGPAVGVAAAVTVATVSAYLATAFQNRGWAKNKILNLMQGFGKISRGKKIISKAEDIKGINVNMDVLKTSRLFGQAFSKQDYNILRELSGDDAYQKVSGILQNMGKEFIKIKEFEKVVEFVDEIKKGADKLPEGIYKDRAKILVGDLEKRVEAYKGLLGSKDINDGNDIGLTSGYKFMRLQNDIYNAKEQLPQLIDAKKDLWWERGSYGKPNWKIFLYKTTNKLNFMLTRKDIQVFNKFDYSKNISRAYKEEMISGADNLMTRHFTAEKREDKKIAKITANYIINMVKSLPERMELEKDGKKLELKDLNLDDPGDRELLSRVYENAVQYEHARIFIDACKLNRGDEKVDALLDNIRKEESPEGLLLLRDELAGKMRNVEI